MRHMGKRSEETTLWTNFIYIQTCYVYYICIVFDALCSGFKVVCRLREAGFMADIDDDRGNTLNKKIRSAQLAQYNYIFGKDLFWDVAVF